MKTLPILLQNKDFIAVDKPEGLSVHNQEDPENLLKVLSQQLKTNSLFPVHRLDKETSGIQVFALHEKAASTLAQEFQGRTVKKLYVGIIRGQLTTNNGVWNKSLTDKAEGWKSPAGVAKDRIPCETQFRVLKSNTYFSQCEFNLITGRQHQIRKHCALTNHALVGDSRYGERKYNERMQKIYQTDRMFLHCQQLELLGHKLSSPIPEIFAKLMQ